MQPSPPKLSKEERDAQKAAEKAAKEAVKARKAAIKSVKAQYKEYCRLIRSKEAEELKAGLAQCGNEDFMTLGGGLLALAKACKAKVGAHPCVLPACQLRVTLPPLPHPAGN